MKENINHTTTRIGLFLSIACAIHCMLMPVVLISFPMLSKSFLHHPFLEWTLLVTLIFLGLFTMDHYKKKHHDSSLPTILFVLGGLICTTALLIHSNYHEWMMIAGSLVIALSHGMNIKLGSTSKVAVQVAA
ncbi:MAG: MerC domain-containing protein [Bacteroidetes bacterium]|nr:MerC domain-containing protein [Bacteroidota bacterium]